MTNKETAEIIKTAIAEVEWEYPMEYAAAFDRAIDVLEQEPKSDWIPASERLPRECRAVLVWCPKTKNIFCAYLEHGRWRIFSHKGNEQIKENIIAWMPLPQPPEEMVESEE